MRLTAFAAASFLLLSAGGDQPAAQSKKPFIADDILDVSTAAVADMTDDGARVAVTIRRMRDNADTDNYRYGDPTYVAPSRVQLLVLEVKTGAKQLPFKQLVNLRQASWSHDGTRLAILLVDNPEDLAPMAPSRQGRPAIPGMAMGAGGGAGRGQGGDPSQAPGGRGRGRDESSVPLAPGGVGSVPRLYIWDTVKAKLTEVPRSGDTAVTVNSGLDWTPDDSRLIVSVRPFGSDRTAREKFLALTEGPIVVHSSKEPFLEWDLLQRENRRRGVVEIDPATGGPTRILLDQRITSYNVSRDATLVTYLEDVTEKTDYEEIGGTMNRLRLASRPAVGEPKTLVEAADLKGVQLRWSDDGRTFAYAKKGEVFVQRIDEAKPRSLTPPPPEEAKKPEADKAAAKEPEKKEEKKETFAVSMFSRDGAKLLVTSAKGWYLVDVASAARTQLLTLDEDEEKNPRREVVAWSPDGSAIYFTESERVRWNRGLMRLDVASKKAEALVKDARLFSGFRMARNGESFVFSMSDGDQPADLYVADARFGSIKRLVEANPWIADRTLPKSELVPYRDADGKLLYGVLRYPANYVKGQKYPTVFELYETFFDNGFNARAAFLASHGYAVFHPSVNLVVGRPGEAWLKGVTSAANRLIEMGVADADRLGVHGTSYGGYATVLLITQTDRFKAAINVSGKVDMVSFYTDSPRLGVRNTHAPEKSQDRIGGTLWEYPERYLEHSAILRADRIKTPLLCITGDQDPNVPASQSREIYYALRRLGKEVEWVRYVNGAHRPPSSAEESVDFEKRILGWYDKYLKPEAKPAAK